MHRRQFLAGVGGAAGVGLAGCVGAPRAPAAPRVRDPRAGTDAALSESDLPVPESELVRAAPRDGIPAITDPVFGADWSGVTVEGETRLRGEYEVEPRLQPADEVIGVERDGEARAYPLKLLSEHEAVNDTFGGPLLVTFCPLCGSSLTARRTVDGAETTVGVSGLLYRWDLVIGDGRTRADRPGTHPQGGRWTGHTRDAGSDRPGPRTRCSGSRGWISTPRRLCTGSTHENTKPDRGPTRTDD